MDPKEKDFMDILEKFEARQFAMGNIDDFVEIEIIADAMKLEYPSALKVANNLAKKRCLLLDRSTEKDLVKSKLGNIVKSLFYATTRARNRFIRDVSDLKYLRYMKQIPTYSVYLDNQQTRKKILDCLKANSGFQKDVIEAALLAIASIYPKVSSFQISSAQEILNLFCENSNESLVITAETGAGKTLAYQLPLLFWILNKKIKVYLKEKTGADSKLNCSALLLFPRNVLARDQYDELVSLSNKLNEQLDKKLNIPTNLRDFLKICIEKDFGGINKTERERIYKCNPDIIITNPDTLKRRLMNPLCTELYQKGIDLILYDEVHLYYGLFGSNVSSLNARLQNLLPNSPLFVGMSATIANPRKHCQKLFSLNKLPKIITDRDDILRNFSIEHHVIIKPRAGRSSLGVCIDTTSCLLHNRRENMLNAHNRGNRLRPKSICFVDSLDLTARWASDQKNYEYFWPFQAVRQVFRRGYPIHFSPWALRDPSQSVICGDCKAGKDIIANLCPEYQTGQCWWFSLDNASPVRWLHLPNGVTPNDNIRVKRLTSQEFNSSELEDIYSLFYDQKWNLPIDALMSTSVLEVGVDFKEIKEVIMYGEIRSPSSYKQKAGRGGREGNLEDGLFVMTTIPPSPLANYYYRHFQRLVFPSLVPLPLEPRNYDILCSHSFCAVFDFLALQGIDIFNIITANEFPEQVEKDFDASISFLEKSKTEAIGYVSKFLMRLGLKKIKRDEIAREAINKTITALEYLSSNYQIEDDRKKLVIWIFEAFRDMGIMASLEDNFEANLERKAKNVRAIIDSRESVEIAIKRIRSAISLLDKEYQVYNENIELLLSSLGTIL